VMADTRATIPPVTQALAQRCPRSSGTLSAISLEWVSAINGMRRQEWIRDGKPEARAGQDVPGQVAGPGMLSWRIRNRMRPIIEPGARLRMARGRLRCEQ
jgi:hypothetical protein